MTEPNQPKIVVSGVQPSGRLHVGNYLGAVRNWLELQGNPAYRCHFFIADWHSLTQDYATETKRRQVLETAAAYLALGLDPDKVTLFAQSDVLDHAELAWILNCVTPMGELERMTQYKDKAKRSQQNVNVGLFTYPILQAADILIYKGEFVPVGQDQVQHVEITRDAAKWFNRRFGDLFPETKPLLTATAKVRSVTEPTAKMSKSHGDKACLYLTDSPDELLAKVKRCPTEASGEIKMSETEVDEAIAALAGDEPDELLKGMAGVWNLIALVREFGSREEADQIVASQPIRYGDLKKRVAELVGDRFAAFRERYAELMDRPQEIDRILAEGAAKARPVAAATMREVRERIGLGHRR
jgi:tryptophanyl-tRNA synthetase